MCLYFFYDDWGAFYLFDHLAIKHFLILSDYNLNFFQIFVIISQLYFLVFLDQNFNSINPLPLPLLFSFRPFRPELRMRWPNLPIQFGAHEESDMAPYQGPAAGRHRLAPVVLSTWLHPAWPELCRSRLASIALHGHEIALSCYKFLPR